MRVTGRRSVVWALSMGLAVTAAACSSGSSGSTSSTSQPPAALTTVTVGELLPGSAGGFLNMAQEQGYYKQFGIDLKVVTFASAAQLSPALVSGNIDMSIEDPEQLLIATSKGAINAQVIGSPMPGLPWAIYGGKGITSLKDLVGKSMAVSTPTGLNQVVAELILKKNGIDPTSVTYVNAGSNANKFEALVAGTVDAASIPSDYVPLAPKNGLHVLALAANVIPQYPRWSIIARNSFLQAHPKAATDYLAALIKGERYAFAHPQAANALAAKTIGGNTKASDPTVTDMYTQIVQGKLVNKTGDFPLNQLSYLQQSLIQLGLLKTPVPVSKVYNDTYRQAALKLIGQS